MWSTLIDDDDIMLEGRSDQEEEGQEEGRLLVGNRDDPDLFEDSDDVVEQSLITKTPQILREDLTKLLYRELYPAEEGSHNTLTSAASMLEKSKELDSVVQRLRVHDDASLRIALGNEFDRIDQTLETWLEWRDGCWILCNATKVR